MPLKKSLRSWYLKWDVIRFTHLASVEWKQGGDSNVVSKKDYEDWELFHKDSENMHGIQLSNVLDLFQNTGSCA